MKALLVLTLILLSSTMARASLGETDAQVEARYGLAAGSPRPGRGCYWKMYSYRSMRVAVIFIDGKSEYERFYPSEHFSSADWKALLAANKCDGSEWYHPYEEKTKPDTDPGGLRLLFNGQEIASASVADNAVFIMSAKWEKLHLHAGNGSSAAPEYLNIPEDSSR